MTTQMTGCTGDQAKDDLVDLRMAEIWNGASAVVINLPEGMSMDDYDTYRGLEVSAEGWGGLG